jgi:type IX secretion system PorP/SprF family membrane protein
VNNVGGGTLGIGIEVGAASKTLGPTGSSSWVATTNWQNDPSVPPQLKKTTFDIGFGLWYQRQNMWFGISSTHLAANKFDDGTTPVNSVPPTTIPVTHNLIYKMARHYWITGGMTLMQGNTWEIRPSFLVKSDATVTSFDLTVLAMFNQSFWFGASYRFQDAIMPMVGFQMPDKVIGENGGLKIGVAYDYTLSNLGDYNDGTVEVFLNYCYPIKITPKTERHGDVRIFE